MQRLLVALVVLNLMFFSAVPQTAADKRKFLPIVFDDWWNVDYVKTGCEMAAKNTYAKPCPAMTKAEDVVRDFENEIEVAFASEAACHDLELLHFTPSMAETATTTPVAPATGVGALLATGQCWQLMLDLDGHSQRQVGREWSIGICGSSRNVLSGHITTPARLAQQICKIAKGVGGKTGN